MKKQKPTYTVTVMSKDGSTVSDIVKNRKTAIEAYNDEKKMGIAFLVKVTSSDNSLTMQGMC